LKRIPSNDAVLSSFAALETIPGRRVAHNIRVALAAGRLDAGVIRDTPRLPVRIAQAPPPMRASTTQAINQNNGNSAHVIQLPPPRTGWLTGAVDSYIGRALVQLHREPAHAWTLDELAEVAGLSRSSLTDRSTRYLGQAPMTYPTQWRLELAAEALGTTNRSVLEIASDVEYESEAAFNRAFKRRFSLPPRAIGSAGERAAVQRLRSSSPRDARVPRLDRSDYTSRRRIPTDSEISSINTVG
jgi:AraC-like DNA-binding protein